MMDDDATELQRWSCYVDEIDDTHVHLVMVDQTNDQGDEREIGSFPSHLLAHLAPVEGQYVTVRIMSDERIVIENSPITDEDRRRGQAEVDALLGMLVQLRHEEEDPIA